MHRERVATVTLPGVRLSGLHDKVVLRHKLRRTARVHIKISVHESFESCPVTKLFGSL